MKRDEREGFDDRAAQYIYTRDWNVTEKWPVRAKWEAC